MASNLKNNIYFHIFIHIILDVYMIPVADPGFDLRGGAWTEEKIEKK